MKETTFPVSVSKEVNVGSIKVALIHAAIYGLTFSFLAAENADKIGKK